VEGSMNLPPLELERLAPSRGPLPRALRRPPPPDSPPAAPLLPLLVPYFHITSLQTRASSVIFTKCGGTRIVSLLCSSRRRACSRRRRVRRPLEGSCEPSSPTSSRSLPPECQWRRCAPCRGYRLAGCYRTRLTGLTGDDARRPRRRGSVSGGRSRSRRARGRASKLLGRSRRRSGRANPAPTRPLFSPVHFAAGSSSPITPSPTSCAPSSACGMAVGRCADPLNRDAQPSSSARCDPLRPQSQGRRLYLVAHLLGGMRVVPVSRSCPCARLEEHFDGGRRRSSSAAFGAVFHLVFERRCPAWRLPCACAKCGAGCPARAAGSDTEGRAGFVRPSRIIGDACTR